MAFCPMGVDPPGVIIVGVELGVAPPGVILGVPPLGVVPPGVMLGVAPGVSSHLERRLLADGVGVSDTVLAPGVAAPCPGVSDPLFSLPGVVCAGVGSHILTAAGVLPFPGVSAPGSFLPGVSAQAVWDGVEASAAKKAAAGFFADLAGVSSDVWSHLPLLLGAVFAPLVSTAFRVPSLAFSAICFLKSASCPFNSCSLMMSAYPLPPTSGVLPPSAKKSTLAGEICWALLLAWYSLSLLATVGLLCSAKGS